MTTRQRHKEIPKAKVAGGHGIPAFRSPKILKLNLARVLLQEQQKTRYEIARRTELHPDTLKNLLQEHPTSINVSALEQICDKFSLDLNDVLTFEKTPSGIPSSKPRDAPCCARTRG